MATPPTVLLVGDPLERISFTIGGRTSRASRQGFALLWEFERRAKNRWPGCRFRIIQPANNTGVPASAGTHDKDDVWDWELIDAGTWAQESELARDTGLWDWVRDPTQGDFGWHHHSIAPGLPLSRYGDLVPAQMDDYRRHALGLKGQHQSGSDPQCFTMGRLTHTVKRFSYTDWKDDHMPISDEQIADIARKAGQVLLDTELTLSDGSVVTVQTALRRAAQTPPTLEQSVTTVIEQIKASASNTNTKIGNTRAALMAAIAELDAQVGP
jgi:hypothetical protein